MCKGGKVSTSLGPRPSLHSQKKEMEGKCGRGSGALDTEGLHGMLLDWVSTCVYVTREQCLHPITNLEPPSTDWDG